MSEETVTLIVLIFVCLLDIVVPVPLLGLFFIYVLLQKPAWFRDFMSRIFEAK